MPRLLIIADDLTGALDSASGFAARGLAARVALDAGALTAALADPALAVITHPTGTRELSPDRATQVMAGLVPILRGFDGILFKKIDSRMKGHIAAELQALGAGVSRPVLASPAIPRLGRFVTQGAVTGFGIDQPIPIAPHLGCAAIIPEVDQDADLDAALPADLSATLYVGAAGLAEALARRLSSRVEQTINHLPLPALLAIGSRDPVTLAQVAAAPVTPVSAPNGDVPALPNAAALTLVQLTQGAAPQDSATVAERFAQGIAAAMRRTPSRTLLACGGETAHAILRELGVTALDLLGEALPGVPAARCPSTDLVVLTKSGGFGPPSLLADLVNKFANFHEIGVDVR